MVRFCEETKLVKPWEVLVGEPKAKQIPKRKRKSKPSNPSPQLPEPPADPMPQPPLQQSGPDPQVHNQSPSQLPQPLPSSDLEFTTFLHTSGLVIRIGSVYFLESFDIPFVVSRIFRSNSQTLASCFRWILSSDRKKIIGFSEDFSCTVNLSYFVRVPSEGEFSFPFLQSINNLATVAQSRLVSCQLSYLGVVSYQRELRRHALGAQMRQAVFSGISLNATKPPKAISLGAFEPLPDQAIFGLSEANSFKIKFEHSNLCALDQVMGERWDVKSLKSGVPEAFFKFVTSCSVYFDRKTFVLKFSFAYVESTFPLSSDYRVSCKAMFK